MIDVGMRQHDGVDTLGGNRQAEVFLPALLTPPLKETAVEEHCLFAHAQDVTRSSDFSRGAEEFELHRAL